MVSMSKDSKITVTSESYCQNGFQNVMMKTRFCNYFGFCINLGGNQLLQSLTICLIINTLVN